MTNIELYKLLRQMQNADAGKGKICAEVNYLSCKVDEKWVDAIERGMSFVGKAIDEERRFIRVNGEILPIEKVKRVSKVSVQHLARHSELITREQQGEDILPDKLYTVERLNDYATYENRFLYRLLVTVKDFVSARYTAISNALGSFHGSIDAIYAVDSDNRKLKVNIQLTDEGFLEGLVQGGEILERLEKIYKTVDFYFATPLMTELSKEDTLNVVTKNNVLKMDTNFKAALSLYDFLMGYSERGFEIERQHKEVELSELPVLCELMAFAERIYGMGLENTFQQQLQNEQNDKLSRLKEQNPQEYILALERRNKQLEQELSELNAAATECNARLAQAEAEMQSAQNCAQSKEETLQKSAEIVAQYAERLIRQQDEHGKQVEALQQTIDELSLKNLQIQAQLTAQNGVGDASFEELERQYEALGKLVGVEWKGTKKMLREQANKQLKEQLFGKKRNGEKQ